MRMLFWILALLMLVAGGLRAFEGMGILGDGSRSSGQAMTGSLLAGLGVALVIVLLQRRD